MFSSILDPACESCSDLAVIVAMNPSPVQETLINALLEMDCRVYPAKSPEDALSKLQFHAFHAVIVEENYSLEVIRLLAMLPMAVRRNLFYVFVGDSIETGNLMQSYVLSANLVVHNRDITDFPQIFQNALLDNNRFYRPFYYALESRRRELQI